MITRRSFLNRLSACAALAAGSAVSSGFSVPALASLHKVPAQNSEVFCPIRRLTNGPLFHWGAYYDQIHFDPTNRYVIANQVDFEGRSPLPTDTIQVALIDTQDNNRRIELGTSVSWNWQQGCMLQWIPGPEPEVVWNDRDGDHFFSTVYNLKTGQKRTLPHPVYALAPNGQWAFHPDFARLNDTRPGYGYCGIPDKNANVLAPQDAGIWKMDLKTGETKLLFCFDDVVKMAPEKGYSDNAKHWFNHLIVNPDSTRFLFLHRWRGTAEKSYWKTRLMTASAVDGSDIRIINPHEMTSHLVWKDPNTIIAFARQPETGDRLYLFNALTGQTEMVAGDFVHRDTHVSFVPGTNNEWILNDSYPDRERFQQLFLIHIPTNRVVPLGRFYQPNVYKGEWRCDLHPRCSRDGKTVLIDSTHEGDGRQIYALDIAGMLK